MKLLRCLQYEDEDRDKVVLASDDDLTAAVDHARLAGWKACTSTDGPTLVVLDFARVFD